MREHAPALGRQDRHEIVLDLDRIALSREPEPVRERATCVSTTTPGMPKAFPSTTFAVLRPTPRSRVSSSSVRGTSPPWRATMSAAHSLDRAGLVPEEPGRADHRFQLRRLGAGERRGVGVAGEQPGRHQVHALVGALGGENGRDQELERGCEVERGGRFGIEPLEDLDQRLDPRRIGRRDARSPRDPRGSSRDRDRGATVAERAALACALERGALADRPCASRCGACRSYFENGPWRRRAAARRAWRARPARARDPRGRGRLVSRAGRLARHARKLPG